MFTRGKFPDVCVEHGRNMRQNARTWIIFQSCSNHVQVMFQTCTENAETCLAKKNMSRSEHAGTSKWNMTGTVEHVWSMTET